MNRRTLLLAALFLVLGAGAWYAWSVRKNQSGTHNTPDMDFAVRNTDDIGKIFIADRTGLPVLSNLPVVGNLFGQKSKINRKRELVILIKPTVIKSASDWAEELGGTRERLSGYAQRPTDDWLRRPPASQ